MAKYIPSRNYIGSSEIATDLDVTGPVTFADTVSLGDNDSLYFGNSNDLEIIHDSANSKIENSTGQLTILNTADDKDIVFRTDDGSGGVTDYLRLDGGDSRAAFSVNARWSDDKQVQVGSSSDGAFYHNGTVTRITNVTGNLEIINFADDADVILKSDDGSGGTTAYLTLDGSATNTIFNETAVVVDDKAIMFLNWEMVMGVISA